jgi:hypothetical protein
MTNCYHETLDREVAELVEEWNFENFHATKLVQPGKWDETFNLQDLEYIYEHIAVY